MRLALAYISCEKHQTGIQILKKIAQNSQKPRTFKNTTKFNFEFFALYYFIPEITAVGALFSNIKRQFLKKKSV